MQSGNSNFIYTNTVLEAWLGKIHFSAVIETFSASNAAIKLIWIQTHAVVVLPFIIQYYYSID